MKRSRPLILLLALTLVGCASMFKLGWNQTGSAGSIRQFNLYKSSDLATWIAFTNYPGSTGAITNTVTTLGAGDWWIHATAVSTNGVESDPSNVIRVSIPNAPSLLNVVITP